MGGGISKNNKIIFLDDAVYDFRNVYVTVKIFKRSTIVQNNVWFPEDSISEDVYFIYKLLFYVKKIVYLKDYVGYIRYSRDDSISSSPSYIKIKRTMELYFELYEFYKENNKTDIDFTWLFSSPISYYLGSIYYCDCLKDKEKATYLLNELYKFEKAINFNDSYLNVFNKICNYFIMKKHFKLAIIYFRVVGSIIKHRSIMNFYRSLLKKNYS